MSTLLANGVIFQMLLVFLFPSCLARTEQG